jgi:hypothetical protein
VHVWAFLSAALPAIVSLGSIGTADLAYQVRAGQIMVRTHSFIRTDLFSFTAAGHPWLNQQWLAQLPLAAVYSGFGWPGLSLLQAALVAAIFGFVYAACRRAGASAMHACLLSLAGFAVASTSLALRPQLIAALLAAAEVWILAGRDAKPGRLWLIPAVVILWSNVHGSFAVGPLLAGLACLDDVARRSKVAPRTLLVTGLSVVATLLNPFGPRVWSYAVGISTNPLISRLVTEWQPPTVHHIDDLLFFISVAAMAALLARRRPPPRWSQLLALGVLLLIALTATRNVLWWAVAVPPIAAGLIATSEETRMAQPTNSSSNRSIVNVGIVAVVAAAFVLFAFVALNGGSKRRPGGNVTQAPQGVTAALGRSVRPHERLFNAQGWGSWLELTLPENPVFVDSRIEVFPSRVWDDYLAVSSGRQGWQAILRSWRVAAVVAARDQQAQLIPLIRNDPGWRLVFQDEEGYVFVRR